MSASAYLEQFGVTVAEAKSYIYSNIFRPDVIFNTCQLFGITNDMLAEIVDTNVQVVQSYWSSIGYDYSVLDTNFSESETTETVPDEPVLPTSATDYYGEVYDIVVGTTGNDSFYHTSGNKIYFGMSGDDYFSASSDATGRGVFIGGDGNDTYLLDFTNGYLDVVNLGSGLDTLVAYTGDNYGYNYQIGVTSIIGVETDYLGNATGSFITVSDLSDPSQAIESVYFPYSFDGAVSQDAAIYFLQSLGNWYGVDYANTAATNYDLSTLKGIYNQFLDANIA